MSRRTAKRALAPSPMVLSTRSRGPAGPWEARQPAGVCGVAQALTTLAALPPRKVLVLRVSFWVRRRWPWYRRHRAKPLMGLSFIHFARWALIDHLPGNEGKPDVRLRPTYLLFETNFNGRTA